MKKIIAGAKYDTSTAVKLGDWGNGMSTRDFGHIREALYRTKSGRYFIHGAGGPMTKYARSAGQNSWSGGENIEPVGRAAAMEWAEKHLDADEYEEIFGEITEDDSREALNLTISAQTKAKLRLMSETQGRSISAIIEEMVSKM